MTQRVRLQVVVQGIVQGVGFRPFVYGTAASLALSGSVCNNRSGAVIEVEGEPDRLDAFLDALRDRPPRLAIIESVAACAIPALGDSVFVIADSTYTGSGRTLIGPDVAVCEECAAEQRDPTDRRYRHAFINCTDCGPRFTIARTLPYDRGTTTMAGFPMCVDCACEYRDPSSRRFHAQAICCPNCGPQLSYRDEMDRHIMGEDGLQRARELLRDGGVLAVKGIGGYHLACDAADEGAVSELRKRKQRGDKPFALMTPDIAGARAVAVIDDDCARALSRHQRPIVLVSRLADAPVAPSVAPGNADLGVMLAYAPIHRLLFGLDGDQPGPTALVMTSGNTCGEPICFEDRDAMNRLSGLADGWLIHDRPIAAPCDDSVIRVVGDVELPIRRSRGYVPLPVALPVEVRQTLAVGTDIKNVVALARGRRAWLSQHVGDMDNLAGLGAFDSAARRLQALTGVIPGVIVADAHPRYRSSEWARRNANGIPVRLVQHHHAHIAAVMAENGLDGSQPVLGFAFDGTGFGPDGAIWGGEVLRADYKGYERLCQLKYVPLAGGDLAVHRPYRMALAHLWAAGLPWDPDLPALRACPEAERSVLLHQLESGLGCTPTSSMGRLFDAVSALLGVCQVADYEAQAAIELESQSRAVGLGANDYKFSLGEAQMPIVIEPDRVLRAVVRDLRAGMAAGSIGLRFHHAVAQLIVDLAFRFADGSKVVALSGGVFQNALLLRVTLSGLRDSGFEVITHRVVPPNDGGIALGQLMVGNA